MRAPCVSTVRRAPTCARCARDATRTTFVMCLDLLVVRRLVPVVLLLVELEPRVCHAAQKQHSGEAVVRGRARELSVAAAQQPRACGEVARVGAPNRGFIQADLVRICRRGHRHSHGHGRRCFQLARRHRCRRHRRRRRRRCLEQRVAAARLAHRASRGGRCWGLRGPRAVGKKVRRKVAGLVGNGGGGGWRGERGH